MLGVYDNDLHGIYFTKDVACLFLPLLATDGGVVERERMWGLHVQHIKFIQ
jgi:hypothetical protein